MGQQGNTISWVSWEGSKKQKDRGKSSTKNKIRLVDWDESLSMWGLLKKPFVKCQRVSALLAACVLCHRLGALRDSMLGELSWQEKADSCLNLSAADG